MKNKIALLIIIAFIISCSNNNTNPNNSEGMKEKEELGNVETPTNDGSGSTNNGSTDNNQQITMETIQKKSHLFRL